MSSHWMGELHAHPLRWGMAALCLLTFVPGLDIGFSRLFFEEGAGFVLGRHEFLGFVREAAPIIILGSVLFCLLLWIAGLVFRQSFLGVTTREIAFLVTTLAIGPGILVETLLKSYWGRARPNDTVYFGGEAAFSPPAWIAQECAHNCSFPSGHAALAFWTCAYGFLLPAPWQRRAITAGLFLGGAVGLVRVLQGAHFLSDVVFSGALVLVVNTLAARLLMGHAGK